MKNKTIMLTFLANAFDHYQQAIYSFFSFLLAPIFFPNCSGIMILIGAFSVFAAGYISQPIGSLIFGYIGDRFGRKPALVGSLVVGSLPTLLIGVLPSYQVLGIFSSITLLLCRLLQGVSIGGEFGTSIVFISEKSSKEKAGLNSGLLISMGFIGAIFATSIGSYVMKSGFPEWFWRLPFIFGGLLGLFSLWLRKYIDESSEFKKSTKLFTMPLWGGMKSYPRNMICSMIFGCSSLVPLFLATISINLILKEKYGLGSSQVLVITTYLLILCGGLCPIVGYLSGKYGEKRILLSSVICSLVCAGLFYIAFNKTSSLEFIFLLQAALAISTALGSSMFQLMPKLFPTQYRCSALGFSFFVGQALITGMTPLFATFLIKMTDKLTSPALLLVGSSFLLGAATYFSRRIESLDGQERELAKYQNIEPKLTA